MICPKCGKIFHSRFCPKCGYMSDADDWFEDMLKYPEPNPAEIPDRIMPLRDVNLKKVTAKERGVYNPKEGKKSRDAGYEVFEPSKPTVSVTSSDVPYRNTSTMRNQPKFTVSAPNSHPVNTANTTTVRTAYGTRTSSITQNTKSSKFGLFIVIIIILIGIGTSALDAVNDFTDSSTNITYDVNDAGFGFEEISYGDTYLGGNMHLTLSGTGAVSDDYNLNRSTDYIPLSVYFNIEKTNDDLNLDIYDFVLIAESDLTCDNVTPNALQELFHKRLSELNVGDSTSFELVFNVPIDSTAVKVRYTGNSLNETPVDFFIS